MLREKHWILNALYNVDSRYNLKYLTLPFSNTSIGTKKLLGLPGLGSLRNLTTLGPRLEPKRFSPNHIRARRRREVIRSDIGMMEIPYEGGLS